MSKIQLFGRDGHELVAVGKLRKIKIKQALFF